MSGFLKAVNLKIIELKWGKESAVLSFIFLLSAEFTLKDRYNRHHLNIFVRAIGQRVIRLSDLVDDVDFLAVFDPFIGDYRVLQLFHELASWVAVLKGLKNGKEEGKKTWRSP